MERTQRRIGITKTGKTAQDNCDYHTITEEEDEEEYLNSMQNPLDDTELSVLISTITGNTDNSKWINSKSTMATKIQAEINVKKEILPLEEQTSLKKKWHDSLNLGRGITRSK